MENLKCSPGEGLIEDRLPIIKKAMIEGRADNPNYIVILVGRTKKQFVVNKSLLKLASRFWEKLIAEKASESNDMLKFPEILPKYFQAMLEYGILEMPWTFLNLKDTCGLIETAFQFGLYNFVEGICESVLLKVEAVKDYYNDIFDDEDSMAVFLLQSFGFESLRQTSLEHILENAFSIFEGNHFLRLSLEDFGEILIQDKLKVESEVKVLNALMRWGMNVLKIENKLSSPEILRNVLAEPLNWIRFPNMSKLEFRDYVIPLELLTDQQVKVMELWYKNDGSISVFNKQPREYLKAMNSSAAAPDEKSMEELLHAAKLGNLLANFDIKVLTHNLEIQACDLAKKCEEYVKLELKVQQMESIFKWQELMEVIRFYQKLETLRKRFVRSSAATFRRQKIENDHDLWKILAEKIRKGEDFSEIISKMEEPERYDSQLLKSVNEAVGDAIVELLKVKSREIYEPVSWRIFQKESDSTVAELQKFENTETFACAIILKNNTSETLENFQIHVGCGHTYISLPNDIQPFCTHQFGQTHSKDYTYGVLYYDIGTTRIVIRHYFRESHNDFGIGIVPVASSLKDRAGFDVFANEVWKESTKIKALGTAPKEMEKRIKLGNLCLHTELIGTGPKAVVRVLLTDSSLL